MQAQQELLKEDEMFKNLSKDEISKILLDIEPIEEIKIDKAGMRKMIKNIKTLLNVNLEKRQQHANDAEQFLDSEAELHSSLKEIQFISALPQYAEEFIKNEGIELMLEILDHPNPDIWIESITLLSEITDEETLTENP